MAPFIELFVQHGLLSGPLSASNHNPLDLNSLTPSVAEVGFGDPGDALAEDAFVQAHAGAEFVVEVFAVQADGLAAGQVQRDALRRVVLGEVDVVVADGDAVAVAEPQLQHRGPVFQAA
jgi:hypothetical protein